MLLYHFTLFYNCLYQSTYRPYDLSEVPSMNLNIAICDDDPSFIQSLEQLLLRYQFASGQDFHITRFSNGEDLLAAFEQGASFHILLLDIEIKNSNGIDIAKLIKENYTNNIYLIFISSYPEYMLESFDAHPYYFMNKPVSPERINSLFNEIINDIESNRPFVTLVVSDLSTETINLRDIYFVETLPERRNYCLVHTQDRAIECRGSISYWNETLRNAGFLQCHRGTIINLRHIHYIEKDYVVLNNNMKIKISRSNQKVITDYFLMERFQQTHQ